MIASDQNLKQGLIIEARAMSILEFYYAANYISVLAFWSLGLLLALYIISVFRGLLFFSFVLFRPQALADPDVAIFFYFMQLCHVNQGQRHYLHISAISFYFMQVYQ